MNAEARLRKAREKTGEAVWRHQCRSIADRLYLKILERELADKARKAEAVEARLKQGVIRRALRWIRGIL